MRLFLSANEGGQAGRVQCLETARYGTRPKCRPGPRRPSEALEIPHPEVLEFEKVAKKFSCGLGNDHGIRLGDSLQARRKVWRLSDDAALLRLSRSDQIANHDQPGRNPDTGLQRNARL